MSRTLFWYVFWDLVKIFMMASGALAGIMSFGGLLRPLTQNGLDGGQVALMLRYLMPAMSTYSLPVAALFATTVVYGRMAADNELTACRASGISFGIMSLPAVVLGILVAILSMFMLGFTVPQATHKVEQVITSNLAKIIAHQIEQDHQTSMGNYVIYAESAYLPPPDPKSPGDQAVVLRGPLIVSYANVPGHDKWFLASKEFWLASEATVFVHEDASDETATLRATLKDGVVFPRRFDGPKAQQGGIGTAEFGPVDIPSRLAQKPKYMTIFELKELEKDPTRGQAVLNVTQQFIREDQAVGFNAGLMKLLNDPGRKCVMSVQGDSYSIVLQEDAPPAELVKGVLTLKTAQNGKPIVFRQENGGQTRLMAEARRAKVITLADTDKDLLSVTIELDDALVDANDTPSPQEQFTRKFSLPMPQNIAAMKLRTAERYLNGNVRPEAERQKLLRALVDLLNHVYGEMHARAAFVVSCLLLVLVGASLGMMFRSGNFLTAFAVSVVPAMLSTVMIVTGQHTCESTPEWIRPNNNPLFAGIVLIWTSNVVIAIAAAVLLIRLHRK